MNTPADLWALGRLNSVERVVVDADGTHVTLKHVVGFNAVNHFVSLAKPERVLNEWIATGSVDGHPVIVSLPLSEQAVSA